jgi:hypothetical protein
MTAICNVEERKGRKRGEKYSDKADVEKRR